MSFATDLPVPPGARRAARVVLVSAEARVLLLHARDAHSGRTWWITPGGGVEPGETFEAAASRELFEETGWRAEIGPCRWTRHHRGTFQGRPFEQYERFFVARIAGGEPHPRQPDAYVTGYRWWSESELAATTDVLAPRRLAMLVGPILRNEPASAPFDCGA